MINTEIDVNKMNVFLYKLKTRRSILLAYWSSKVKVSFSNYISVLQGQNKVPEGVSDHNYMQ